MKVRIGTVTILRDRKYEDVIVPSSSYPVYLDDDKNIYWEMQGYTSEWRGEPTIERVEGLTGVFMVQPPPGDVIVSTEIKTISSHKFSISEFERFITTDVLCCEGPDRRLVFNFEGFLDH